LTTALGFSANGTEQFRITSGNQLISMFNGSAAAPNYTWNTSTNTGIFLFGLNDFRFSTGGTTRMRIGQDAGGVSSEIWVNQASPYIGDIFSATSTLNGDFGVNGYNINATATTGGGVYGEARAATTNGVWGVNIHANGTGVVARGDNAPTSYTLTNGSGIASTGQTTGVASFIDYFGGTGTVCYYGQEYGASGGVWRVGYWNGFTYRKIEGTGSVNTVVDDLNGNKVVLSCPEAPENLFMDYGKGKLVNGKAYIKLDPIFSKNIHIDAERPLRVFIQLEDNEFCKGVVVKNKSKEGFEVVELDGGKSNTPFIWQVVANRADEVMPNGKVAKYSVERFAPAGPRLPVNTISRQNER
jgi:hypothetical protein